MRWALIFHAVCLMTALRAAEDGYTKSVRVDGLPIRLNETGWLSEAIESDSSLGALLEGPRDQDSRGKFRPLPRSDRQLDLPSG